MFNSFFADFFSDPFFRCVDLSIKSPFLMSFGLDWSTISNVSSCAFYFCYTAAGVVCLCMKLRTHTPWIWSDNRFSFFIFLVTKAKISSSSSSSYYLLYCPLPYRTHTRGAVSMLNTFRLLLVTCQYGAVGCERPWLCVFHSRSIQFLFVKLFNLIRAYDGGVLIYLFFLVVNLSFYSLKKDFAADNNNERRNKSGGCGHYESKWQWRSGNCT